MAQGTITTSSSPAKLTEGGGTTTNTSPAKEIQEGAWPHCPSVPASQSQGDPSPLPVPGLDPLLRLRSVIFCKRSFFMVD